MQNTSQWCQTGYTRGSVIQRVFAHDVYHSAELNEAFGRIGSAMVDFWD